MVCSSRQRIHWSDSSDAQADLSLRWAYINDGTFSSAAAQLCRQKRKYPQLKANLTFSGDWNVCYNNSAGPQLFWILHTSHVVIVQPVLPLIDKSVLPFISAASSENVPSDMCTERRFSQPANSRSLVRIFIGCILTVKLDISCGQRRFRSVCGDAQADLSLRLMHISEGAFSDVGTYLVQTVYRIFPVRTNRICKQCNPRRKGAIWCGTHCHIVTTFLTHQVVKTLDHISI